MNVALLIAGGTGSRTGQDVPKQFLTVYDTPVIVYTMRNIEETGLFDELYVVCADGWKDFIETYAKQYNVNIFKGTVTGGDTRLGSFSNGFEFLSANHSGDDVVCLSDGNRPLIPSSVFADSIAAADSFDCVLPLEPCFDSMYVVNKGEDEVSNMADRNQLFKGQTPETAKLGTALDICRKAKADGIKDLPICSLALKYDYSVGFVSGSSKSMKITTADDFAIFKALIGEKRYNNLK